MKSELSGLIVSDFKIDKSMVFIDLSIYNTQIPIKDAKLSILKPYALVPIEIPYTPKNNTIITSIDLDGGMIIESPPCGLYKITQSICPNDKLYNEIWYVHTGQIKRDIADLYCNGKIDAGKEMLDKIIQLEYLASCPSPSSEKRILTLLESMSCAKKTSCNTTVMNPIIRIKEQCPKKIEKQCITQPKPICGCKCKSSCTCGLLIDKLTIN
jgi:hypothetical protein